MKKEKVVIIFSGGMDSTTLIYEIKHKGYDIYALGFDYGQRHKKELIYARRTCEKLNIPFKIINLRVLNELAPSALTRKNWEIPKGHYEDEVMKQTVVPNRNMVLLSLATSFAIGIKAKKLFYGAHAGDHAIYPDCRFEFVEAMKKSIELCDWKKVKLESPYILFHKEDILKRGFKLGVDYKSTWSCYLGNENACGKCGACVERLEAFKKLGKEDMIKYENK